jgi:hypothetical protein
MPNDKKVFRIDKVTIKDVNFDRLTPEGFLVIDAAITRSGVFEYRNPITGDIRLELRHPDDIFQKFSIDSLKLKPITNDHPSEMVTSDNVKQLTVGTIGENVWVDGEFIMATITVQDENTIQQIRDGKRELSCGYFALTIEDEGVYIDGDGNEIPHTHRQTFIDYNHLAVVDKGRAGSNVRIPAFDSSESDTFEGYAIQQKRITDKTQGKSEPKSDSIKENRMVKLIIDNVDYEVAPQVEVYVSKLRENLQSAEAKADGINEVKIGDDTVRIDSAGKKLIDQLTGKVDAQKEKITELEKRDHSEEINAGVRRRAQILKVADTVLPPPKEGEKKFDEQSNSDLQKAIIIELTHKDHRKAKREKLDHQDTSQDYLDTVFDTMIESIAIRDPNAMKRQNDAISSTKDGGKTGDDDGEVDFANERSEMGKRDAEKSQPKKEGSK